MHTRCIFKTTTSGKKSMDVSALPDCVIVEWLVGSVPAVWHRLSDAVPFVGVWTWHEPTMLHQWHPFVTCNDHNARCNCGDNGDEWRLNSHVDRRGCGGLPTVVIVGYSKKWYRNGIEMVNCIDRTTCPQSNGMMAIRSGGSAANAIVRMAYRRSSGPMATSRGGLMGKRWDN